MRAPKVALVEWWPRPCGSVAWGSHLASAARGGAEIDLLTFSKSGRWLGAWSNAPRAAYRVEKIRDAVTILNSYDFVILVDLVCFAPEIVKRGKELPYYVEVLRQLKVPFTAMYHGGLYPSKYDETIAAVLGAPAFTGKLITTRMKHAAARFGGVNPKLRWHVDPHLPYDQRWVVQHGVAASRCQRRTILMTSRIAVNKGQNALLLALPHLKGDVELWGYNSFGLPSIGWRLWELSRALGYEVESPPALRRDKAALTHPDAVKFYTGAFTVSAGGNSFKYVSDFADGVHEVDWNARLHVALSSADFGETLEYVTLDAIAAGVPVAVPANAIAAQPEYRRAVPTLDYTACTGWSSREGDRITGDAAFDESMIDTINQLVRRTPGEAMAAAATQRKTVLRNHHPERVFEGILKAFHKEIKR